MKNTKSASLEELRAMHNRGELQSPRENAPTVDMPDGFWDTALPQAPKAKQAISMRVDPEVLAFFKAQGEGYQTRINAVLRSYVEAHKKHHASG
jgi:uncharacterized protein (DUF4415 family)